MKSILLYFLIAFSLVSCLYEDPTNLADPILTTDADVVVNDLRGSIVGNITLTKANSPYTLSGSLFVKAGATLTIEPGTIIQVNYGQTNTFIAVEQDAKINAAGTALEPIKFTSNSPSPAAGDWGGIVIVGNTRTNAGPTAQTEVSGLTYGKPEGEANSADNSGVLSHIIIEYSGAKINGDGEFNGLSLYSVGSGTTINNIVIKHGGDDGVEIFGGTVNIDNILCVNIADDMFDFTAGYTGTINNGFGVREDGFNLKSGDPRGIEGDSNSSDSNSTPISTPTFNGLTILNLDKTNEITSCAEIRRGSIVTINNAAFVGYDGAKFNKLLDTKDGSGNGTLTITSAYKQGITASNNVGGTITGLVTSESDLFDGTSMKVGRGADFSVFSWSGYTIP